MEGDILFGTFRVPPRCIMCDSDDLRMPDDAESQDDLRNDSLLTCGECGAVITWAALVESCEAKAANNVEFHDGDI